MSNEYHDPRKEKPRHIEEGEYDKNGLSIIRHRDNSISDMGYLEEGLRTGTWEGFYSKANSANSLDNRKYIGTYKNNLREGYFQEFTLDGKESSGEYKENKKVGVWNEKGKAAFYMEGQRVSEGQYNKQFSPAKINLFRKTMGDISNVVTEVAMSVAYFSNKHKRLEQPPLPLPDKKIKYGLDGDKLK